jgi:hypothetical protein
MKYVKVVNDSLHELYKEYVAQPLPLTPAYVEDNNVAANASVNQGNPSSTGDGLLDFDMYLSENRNKCKLIQVTHYGTD